MREKMSDLMTCDLCGTKEYESQCVKAPKWLCVIIDGKEKNICWHCCQTVCEMSITDNIFHINEYVNNTGISATPEGSVQNAE